MYRRDDLFFHKPGLHKLYIEIFLELKNEGKFRIKKLSS